MKVKAPDLNTDYPRRLRELLAGYYPLPRKIDKGCSSDAETPGKYFYPCPMDQSLLEFIQTSPEGFYEEIKIGMIKRF